MRHCINRALLATAALWTGVLIPLLYFGNQFVAATFFPGYSFLSQDASTLGSADSRWPELFNIGSVVTGIFCGFTACGFIHALRRRSSPEKGTAGQKGKRDRERKAGQVRLRRKESRRKESGTGPLWQNGWPPKTPILSKVDLSRFPTLSRFPPPGGDTSAFYARLLSLVSLLVLEHVVV